MIDSHIGLSAESGGVCTPTAAIKSAQNQHELHLIRFGSFHRNRTTCPLLSRIRCACWEGQGCAGWGSRAPEPLPEVKPLLSQGTEWGEVFEVPYPMSQLIHGAATPLENPGMQVASGEL